MNYIIEFIRLRRRLLRELSDMDFAHLVNDNKYVLAVSKLRELFELSVNGMTFEEYPEYDSYSTNGFNNGSEKVCTDIELRYESLMNIAHSEVVLRCESLALRYNIGQCTNIDNIFCVTFDSNVLYLTDGIDTKYLINKDSRIFEFLEQVNAKCYSRLCEINSIINTNFHEFKALVLEENKRLILEHSARTQEQVIESMQADIEKFLITK